MSDLRWTDVFGIDPDHPDAEGTPLAPTDDTDPHYIQWDYTYRWGPLPEDHTSFAVIRSGEAITICRRYTKLTVRLDASSYHEGLSPAEWLAQALAAAVAWKAGEPT